MTLEERRQKAYDAFKSGRNCAQSVAVAFADVAGLDEATITRAAAAFGGGFGRTRNLCGAVSACGLVLGLCEGQYDDCAQEKADVYKQVQQVYRAFEERNGSANCGELLANVKNLTQGYVPQTRDETYYKVRPCVKFVLDAVEILYGALSQQGKLPRE